MDGMKSLIKDLISQVAFYSRREGDKVGNKEGWIGWIGQLSILSNGLLVSLVKWMTELVVRSLLYMCRSPMTIM